MHKKYLIHRILSDDGIEFFGVFCLHDARYRVLFNTRREAEIHRDACNEAWDIMNPGG
jgi:hypothetical protein